jgi:hypothetical protein
MQSPSTTQVVISMKTSFEYTVYVQDTQVIRGAKKGKIVPLHAIILYWGSRGVAPPILNLSARLR